MSWFKNNELSKGFIYMLVTAIAAVCINLSITNAAFEEFKGGYLNIQASLIGKIKESSPESISEIVPLLKENSEKYAHEGKEILKGYGYDVNLQREFINPLKGTFYKIRIYNTILISVIVLITMGILFLSLKVVYKKIRVLTFSIKETLEGNFNDTTAKYDEGDYGKLVFAFNDVRERLHQGIINIRNEKVFLSNILSDISHQLKTPLASLKMYNEILITEELLEAEKRTFIENSKVQINRMEWLIKNLLKLAKLDAGAVTFNMRLQSLSDTVADSLDMLYTKIREKNIKVNLPQEEFKLLHDREWLSEALINIIKNGIEHSAEGGEIRIFLEQNSLYSKILIEDNGTGIDKEDLPKIFNRFYKSKRNKSKESIGIGLSLSNSIVEANGGIIEVESELGKGTRFILTFLHSKK